MSAAAHEKPMGTQEVAGIGLDVVGAFVTAFNLVKLNAFGVVLGVGTIVLGEFLRRRGRKHRVGGH